MVRRLNRIAVAILIMAIAGCKPGQPSSQPSPPTMPSVTPAIEVADLGSPVSSPIEELPVPKAATLLTRYETPAPDEQGGETAVSDIAEYELPANVTPAIVDEWYLRELPRDGKWKNWERNFPPPGERSVTGGSPLGYAWTGDAGCLLLESRSNNERLRIRIERTNAHLCLQ